MTDHDADLTARSLWRQDGLPAGITTVANVWAARRLAARLGAGEHVVTVAVDSGLKSLSGDLLREA